MRFILFIMSMLLLAGCGNSIDVANLQEGDVVFIESQSSQSPYIKVGTMSKWTHCGVVVNTPQGMKVLEASKTVRLTSFESFIGVAKNDNWCLKRPEHKLSKPISPTRAWGLFEIENGEFRVTYRPQERKPVVEYLSAQKRFRHLKEEQINEIQEFVDNQCEELGI